VGDGLAPLTAEMQTALNTAPGISHVASTDYAFMVRTTDGVFYVWGNADYGGSLTAEMQTTLNAAPGISHVASTGQAFMVRVCHRWDGVVLIKCPSALITCPSALITCHSSTIY
jgi:hypothetical protein